MKKVLLLFVLFFITVKSYSIIFWQPYPITAVVAANGQMQRIECSVYDSLLGAYQYYNTPCIPFTFDVYSNTSTIIAFSTYSFNQADSLYGFIAYDQELHQFMPLYNYNTDPDYTGTGFYIYENVVEANSWFDNVATSYSNSYDTYTYNIISHSWAGGFITSADDFNDETCSVDLAIGALFSTHWNDDFDNGPISGCGFFDPVSNSFPSTYNGSNGAVGNQDIFFGSDYYWHWGYFSAFDPALHGWSTFFTQESKEIQIDNGIFHAFGSFDEYFGIYDDSLHHWMIDYFYNHMLGQVIKDKVIAYEDSGMVKYQVFSPTSHAWIRDSSQTNGVINLHIQEGTVNWLDSSGTAHIAGYIDTIGWGNFNTPLQLNFHITDLYDSTGYPLIYVRDYSIGTDSTWYDFGDGIETAPGVQHSLWHLYKVNEHYSASLTPYSVCINANTSSGVQTSCGGKTLNCLANLTVKNTCPGVCNGSVNVVPTLGIAPFTYSWSNGDSTAYVDSLCPGNYAVTITDSMGNSVMYMVSITTMTASASVSTTHCAGNCDATAIVHVAGGTLPYSYVWNTGNTTNEITNLCAGNYSVTVLDSNNCTNTFSMSVVTNTQPLSLFSSTVTTPDCNWQTNGYLHYVFSGGTPPFLITTDTTLNVVTNTVNGHYNIYLEAFAAGIYTTTITDAFGCAITLTDTLDPPPITAFSVTGVNPSCYGVCDGSFITNITGGTAPFHFEKCNHLPLIPNTLCAISYCVLVVDSFGCFDTAHFILTNPPPIVATSIIQNPSCIGCSNGFIALHYSGGIPPYTIIWNPNNGFISGDTIYNLLASVYSITITDSNGCDKTITKTLFDPPVSVFELSSDNAIVISPNPAKDEFTIYLNDLPLNGSTSRTVEIYNAIGEKIYIDFKLNTGSITVNSEKFSRGIYFVKLKTEQGDIIKKLVIE